MCNVGTWCHMWRHWQNVGEKHRQAFWVLNNTMFLWNMDKCIRVRNYVPFTSTCIHPRFLVGSAWLIFFGGIHMAHLFSFLCCVLFVFVQCIVCQCLWNVRSWLHLQFSLTFIYLQCLKSKDNSPCIVNMNLE